MKMATTGMMLVLEDEQVESLKAGNQVKRVYTNPFDFDDSQRISVMAQSNRGFEVDIYVRVVERKIEQRGKGRKRPQYNYTYTFEKVQ